MRCHNNCKDNDCSGINRGKWQSRQATNAKAKNTRATIARATAATSNSRADAMIAITAIARATKEKGQLANKPCDPQGVHRTSYARHELCELKQQGASRSYHRVDG